MNNMQTGLPKIRISVLERDIGYMPDLDKSEIRVMVDGVERFDCFTVDEHKGLVNVIVKDEQGKVVREGDHPAMRTINGDVRLEGISDADRAAHMQDIAENRRLVSVDEIYGNYGEISNE